MAAHERMDLRGYLTILRRDPAGREEVALSARNSIMLSGRDLVARLFVGQAGVGPVSHVAIGTGTRTNAPEQTGLEREIFRKPLEPFDPARHIQLFQADRQRLTLTAELDFQEPPQERDAGPIQLTEAGLFNAAEAGVMYNRVTFPPINKTGDFKLTLIWEIVF